MKACLISDGWLINVSTALPDDISDNNDFFVDEWSVFSGYINYNENVLILIYTKLQREF